MGFTKEEKTVKQKEEEKRREEEQEESIVLETPRRASFSFDKVETTPTRIVGRQDDSFVSRHIRPRNAAPQH